VEPTGLSFFFKIQNQLKLVNSNRMASSAPKNTQTLHEARFEYSEQISQLDQLQNPNRIHAINFGTDSNLNLL
jgi:hypothetical protein